jgi:hypothetical protein
VVVVGTLDMPDEKELVLVMIVVAGEVVRRLSKDS